ncbi:aldehyde dehydrogenase family protein [Janibacter corallicola]|uniref:aldehyde dehydrogenase family protein n=1 Tax=Janibacter corallicola TaxID=415212 RepID=UPI000A078A17|nr:aldehyde dehydrogenase family protein [Janibacter corallicola]
MSTTTDEPWSKERVAELKRRHAKDPSGTASRWSHPATPEATQAPPTPSATPAASRKSPQAAAASEKARAGQMLERARWAARAYGTYTKGDVDRIVTAVARAAAGEARRHAEMAVAETTFGVVEHKERKNLACSVGLLEEYAGHDYVTPRVHEHSKIVEIPRPAGVVLAITPSTNPVATTYFKTILALMTRNAVVISPHPMAKHVCADAARVLAQAAEAAGAPSGIVQCVENPTIPLVETLMGDPRTGVIVATGGTGVVRSAYSSSNPALGVGPGNVPVMVDSTADIRAAAQRIVDSKAFDNSVLCTNESVLIVEESVADALLAQMERAGAHLLETDEVANLTAHMFPMGKLNTDVVGRDAHLIAADAGIRSGPATKVLLAPFEAPVPEEMMTHEKLSPVLGVLRVPDAARGIAAARSIVRIAGSGHSAALHSTDPETIMQFGATVPVLRVAVNVGSSTGSSGLDTNLAPTMTVGTGFIGNSGLGENLQPKHLLDWARIAYNSDDAETMADFGGRSPWEEHAGPVPVYPWAANDPRAREGRAPEAPDAPAMLDRVTEDLTQRSTGSLQGRGVPTADESALRAEIRRLVAAELSTMLKD